MLSVTVLGSSLTTSSGVPQEAIVANVNITGQNAALDLAPGTYRVSTGTGVSTYGTFTVDALGQVPLSGTTGAVRRVDAQTVDFDKSQLAAVSVKGGSLATSAGVIQNSLLAGVAEINRVLRPGDVTVYLPAGAYSVVTETGLVYGTFSVEESATPGPLIVGTTTGAATNVDGHTVDFDKSRLAAVTVQGTQLVTESGASQWASVWGVAPVQRNTAANVTMYLPVGAYTITTGFTGYAEYPYGTFQVLSEPAGTFLLDSSTGALTAQGMSIGFDLNRLNRITVTMVGNIAEWNLMENTPGIQQEDTLALPDGRFTIDMKIPTGTGGFNLQSETFTIGNGEVWPTALPENSPLVTLRLGRPPVASAGGPYTVGEGGFVLLDASGSSDADQPPETLTYLWDLDGDGFFGETGTAAPRGDETGRFPTFSADGLDGPCSATVALRVSDSHGQMSSDSAVINVTNVAPAITSLTGPSFAVPGQPLSYEASFTDAGAVDTHTTNWQVIDDAGSIVASGFGSSFSYTPTLVGSYTVAFTVVDDDEGTDRETRSLSVEYAQRQTGICSAESGEVLVVGSLTVNDRIHVSPSGGNGALDVTITDRTTDLVVYQQAFTPSVAGFAAIAIFGQGADDYIQVADSIGIGACIRAGAGNDNIKSGGGHDTVLGGEGDDLLIGGNGRDFLIGGTGADRIVGNAEDDILVAGTTAYDANNAALMGIMAEWTSSRTYSQRVANLSKTTISGSDGSTFEARLNQNYFLLTDAALEDPVAPTVFDDNTADLLAGSAGTDWFLFNSEGEDETEKDKATDLHSAEFAADLDWIQQ